MDLSAVLLDGVVPRSGAERCQCLLAEAEYYIYETPARRHGEEANILHRIAVLKAEIEHAQLDEIPTPPLVHPENEYPWWHEIENDIIGLINECLPNDWICILAPDDPGTVIVTDSTFSSRD